MNLLSEPATKTFNLLSIGQRGVGKTVFLAGSYAELHSPNQTNPLRELRFDCQNNQVQANINKILNYVVQTGQYPPPTIKITNFNFSLKRYTETLSHFRWWDIPGEICNIRQPDFHKMVASSHGCCVFIDAYALVHNKAYLQAFEEITTQVVALATLVNLNRLKYAFALILTKCDLLEPGSLSRQQIEERLQPLTTHLDAVRANYQTFYSSIPIVDSEGASSLKATGTADPLLWLVCELNKAHNPGLMNNLLVFVTPLLPSRLPLQQKEVETELQTTYKADGKAFGAKKILDPSWLPTARINILLLTLAIVGMVGVIGLSLSGLQADLPRPVLQKIDG